MPKSGNPHGASQAWALLVPGKKQTICPGVIDSHLKTKRGTCLFNERLAVFQLLKPRRETHVSSKRKNGSLFQLEGIQTNKASGRSQVQGTLAMSNERLVLSNRGDSAALWPVASATWVLYSCREARVRVPTFVCLF